MVELFELRHDHIPDGAAGYLGAARLVKLLLDFIDKCVHGAALEGPFFTGPADTIKQLFPVELLPTPVLFDDEEADRLETLVGGETQLATQALAAAADAVVDIPRVNHLRVVVPAIWAVQAWPPQKVVCRLIIYHYR
ncbi:MAG: hypothetical protein A2Z15_05690 [Chloroflexi bacterium RBG_16_50_11]|nr:MAG: hypothetical protein A2Z15_05690 [Chloroflexi bacterium RBG_16_50_11]